METARCERAPGTLALSGAPASELRRLAPGLLCDAWGCWMGMRWPTRSIPSSSRFNISTLACYFWLEASPFIRLTFSLDSYLLTDSLVNNRPSPRKLDQG